MKATEKAVLASSLCKEYTIGDSVVEALGDLDLEVARGEFVSIYGPSGAGKATLINIIGGLGEPTRRARDLDAYDENFLATFRSAYVGFVFQSYNLISTLTASENVAFPLELVGRSNV